MKLFIHDKCFSKLLEIPKETSKKVLEFQRKFRENSRSEAIHLEPINTFKDPLLRTARIDLKYRAIIRIPESGDSYHMLWVDTHDEAMDWAKNKIFKWNDITQAAQIFTAPETDLGSEQDYKYKAKGLFAAYSDEQLMQIGVPESLMGLTREVFDLNDLGRFEHNLPSDCFENLFYLTEGIPIQNLIAEINEGKLVSDDPEVLLHSINNKRSFVEVDDELIQELINGDLNNWQIFLHPSQRKLVETNYNGAVKVTGGAGTGKTIAALHRLKYLTSNENFNDDRKVLFTTFTVALTTNINLLANKMKIEPHKTQITNIDALVRDLAQKAGLMDAVTQILDNYNSKTSSEVWEEIIERNLTGFDLSFISSEYQSVILQNNIHSLEDYLNTSRIGRGKPISRKLKIELWDLVQKYNNFKVDNNLIDRAELFNRTTDYFSKQEVKPFKNVIADEIQDLSNVELRFLRSLVEEKRNDLFLVGDPYQRIYARKLNFSSAGISVRGKRSKQLRINYRTSEEIKRLAISTISNLNYDDFDGELESLNGYLSLFHGQTPSYEMFKVKADEYNYIVDQMSDLKEQGIKMNEICVGFRTKDALRDFKSFLHRLKIPYSDNSSLANNDTLGLVLSTLHGLKGLEFKAVFLADINKRTSPLLFADFNNLEEQEKKDYINSEKSLLYVAMTRAIYVLRITGTGSKSELINL